jgi:hypothetical protein
MPILCRGPLVIEAIDNANANFALDFDEVGARNGHASDAKQDTFANSAAESNDVAPAKRSPITSSHASLANFDADQNGDVAYRLDELGGIFGSGHAPLRRIQRLSPAP